MRLLLLGGTAWLGRRLARSALERGHEVVCVARGASGDVPSGARLIRADRDDDDALAEASREGWDAVIDVSRQPGQVRRAARDLEPGAEHYLFISSVSAYADHSELDQDEDAPLLDALAGDVMTMMQEYGPAKVACEQAVLAAFGPHRSSIVRPGLIGGPGDDSGRTGYWPLRFAHPAADDEGQSDGAVLVPAAESLSAQVVDVRDLASWALEVAETRVGGVFDAVGEQWALADHLALAREVAGHQGPVVVADPDWLREREVRPWAGPRSLPLWLDDPAWRGMNARRNSRAVAAGLRLRPLADTLRDTLAWERSRGVDTPRASGLTREEERELLADLGG